MTWEEFEAKFPLILRWIKITRSEHEADASTVASLGFQRLPGYYDPETLESAKVVYVDKAPMPPLSAIGLAQFADFEQMHPGGITYLDTFFVRGRLRDDEAIHFHELVHVIQWRALGPKRFLAAYADGLERMGYDRNPLEVMAYTLESVFRHSERSFNVATIVREQLKRLYPDFEKESSLA
ncbi:MAG TPA: hypothetical protein PLU30_15115 [Verrucomicrobiae bacterium]|nr:hypothetical protein [Verrucomicrobiae bacterium]